MVAATTSPKLTLPEVYAKLCAFLRANQTHSVIATNHIAAKHGIHTLPAFHNSDAIEDNAKYATYRELVKAFMNNDCSKLMGQVASGQAEAPAPAEPKAHPLPTRESVLPVAEPAPRVALPAEDPMKAKRRIATETLAGPLAGFIGGRQLERVLQLLRGEEGEFFCDKMVELAKVVAAMPGTYDERGKHPDPHGMTVHLHYFVGGCDWFILEKDTGDAADKKNGVLPQSQAWGWACLGFPDDAEIGYISLPEITGEGAELDFHWTPVTLKEAIEAKYPKPAAKPAAPVPPPPAPQPAAPAPAASGLDALAARADEIRSGLEKARIPTDASARLAVQAEEISGLSQRITGMAMQQAVRNLLHNVPHGIMAPEACTAKAALESALASFAAALLDHDPARVLSLCAAIAEQANLHPEAAALRRLAKK